MQWTELNAFQWECSQRTNRLSTSRPSFAAANQIVTLTCVTNERDLLRVTSVQFLCCGQTFACYSNRNLRSVNYLVILGETVHAAEIIAVVLCSSAVHKLRSCAHHFHAYAYLHEPTLTVTTGQVIATCELWPQNSRPHTMCFAVAYSG